MLVACANVSRTLLWLLLARFRFLMAEDDCVFECTCKSGTVSALSSRYKTGTLTL